MIYEYLIFLILYYYSKAERAWNRFLGITNAPCCTLIWNQPKRHWAVRLRHQHQMRQSSDWNSTRCTYKYSMCAYAWLFQIQLKLAPFLWDRCDWQWVCFPQATTKHWHRHRLKEFRSSRKSTGSINSSRQLENSTWRHIVWDLHYKCVHYKWHYPWLGRGIPSQFNSNQIQSNCSTCAPVWVYLEVMPALHVYKNHINYQKCAGHLSKAKSIHLPKCQRNISHKWANAKLIQRF